MRKRITLSIILALFVLGTAWTQTTIQRSLYVSAKGDDNNNGRSEETPFKTLKKASEAAKSGVIKTITVIGTIAGKSEILQEVDNEIFVTGKTDASGTEKAVLGDVSSGGKVIFTHIQLTSIIGFKVTLGEGVKVSNLNGIGVVMRGWGPGVGGNLIMTDDATITGCKEIGVIASTLTMSGNTSINNNHMGGIIAPIVTMSDNAKVSDNNGFGVHCRSLTMFGNAEISGNKLSRTRLSKENYNDEIANGGGVNISLSGRRNLSMSGNAKIINNTSLEGSGGGVFVPYYSSLDDANISISGNAIISGNTAKKEGGGLYLERSTVSISGFAKISGNIATQGGGIYFRNDTLTMEGGEISDNKAEIGAGVYVREGRGTFNHKGGTITGNEADFIGGGVYVGKGATYTAGGGAVNGNTSGDMGDDNVFRQ